MIVKKIVSHVAIIRHVVHASQVFLKKSMVNVSNLVVRKNINLKVNVTIVS